MANFISPKGNVVLLGCFTSAPQYRGADYLKTFSEVTKRTVYGNESETFLTDKAFTNVPLGRKPYTNTSSLTYYQVGLEIAGKWIKQQPGKEPASIGNLRLNERGSPSTVPNSSSTTPTSKP